MTTDGTPVQQQGQASATEPVQPVAVPVVSGTTQEPPKMVEPQPDEKLAVLVAQKVTEEVAKAVAQAKEFGRRELQSEQDRNKAEAARLERRAKLSEDTLGAVRTRLQTADPEVAKEMELEELRARERGRMTLEQEEALKRQQEEFFSDFYASQNQFVTDLGIDPKDARIDWGVDALTPMEAQKRIHASVAKIQRENIKAIEGSLDVKIKEAEARIKKDLGYTEANSVSTAASVGASPDGIPLNMDKFREWITNIPQKEYETKYAAKVTELMQQGKIK